MAKVRYPFGPAEILALTATGAQAISIESDLTILDGVTVEASADRTINLTIDGEISAGAKIFLKSKTNGTQNNIFGTGFTNPTFAGVAGKTKTQSFTYDGSVFLPDSANIQID